MSHEIARLNQLLAEVGRRDNIELRLNHDGTGGLELKSGVKLFLEYVRSSGKLYLYTPLLPVANDEAGRAALFEAMLACNFLNLGCEAGALAFFRHTGQAVYQTGVDARELSPERLDKLIDTLLDQRDEVLYQLEQAKSSSAAPLRPQAAGASTFDRLARTMLQK
jgi:hypothetical protein